MPEAGLHPDGSSALSHNEAPREDTVDGPVPAIVGDVFGVQMNPDQVYAWYTTELEREGWTRDLNNTSNIRTSIEESARAWTKDSVVARIAIRRKGDPQGLPTSVTNRFETVYEIALIAKPRESFVPEAT